MNKQYIISGVMMVVIALVVVAMYPSPKPTIVNNHNGTPVVTPGSVASPDIISPYFSFGGVRHWGSSMDATQGTTTPCNLQAPAATSTLLSATVMVARATSTAFIIHVAKSASTNNTATTTLLGKMVFAANILGSGDVNATSTIGVLGSVDPRDNPFVFGPNEWLVVGAQGGGGTGGGTANFGGTCTAVWKQFSTTW